MPAPCRALRVALGPRPKRRTHYARGRYYDCVIHVAQSTRRVVSDACYRLRPYNDVATRSCLASSGGVTVRLVCVSCVVSCSSGRVVRLGNCLCTLLSNYDKNHGCPGALFPLSVSALQLQPCFLRARLEQFLILEQRVCISLLHTL